MAVNAKDFSAAFFFHISSLKNATQVTTLPRQNNQIHFGFGKNITVFFHVFLVIGCILARDCSIKEHACAGSENVRNGHIYLQLMEKRIT